MSPLDLHVLGTPPAFVLSQDQTLPFNPSIRTQASRLSVRSNSSESSLSSSLIARFSLCIVFKVRLPSSIPQPPFRGASSRASLHRIPNAKVFVKRFLKKNFKKIEDNQRFRTLTSSSPKSFVFFSVPCGSFLPHPQFCSPGSGISVTIPPPKPSDGHPKSVCPRRVTGLCITQPSARTARIRFILGIRRVSR